MEATDCCLVAGPFVRVILQVFLDLEQKLEQLNRRSADTWPIMQTD